MMMFKYGNVNTWAEDIPLSVHCWKCRFHPFGLIGHETAPYPNAFSKPETVLDFNWGSPNVLDNTFTAWKPILVPKCFRCDHFEILDCSFYFFV
jgi:hypothetical protein